MPRGRSLIHFRGRPFARGVIGETVSSTVSGVHWKANYGEISERAACRVGRVESDTWEASFPIAELADLISVLQGVNSLGVGIVQRGTYVQARKVDAGFFTDVIVEPYSITGVPAEIMRFGDTLLSDLLYTLQLLAQDIINRYPDGWDFGDAPIAMAFDKYGRVTSPITEAYFENAFVRYIPEGTKGDPGAPGADGESAYQVAVDNGFVGTETQWLASLKGDPDPTAVSKTVVDAKGDLLAGTANDTVARLGVGSAGQVLTADPATATGLKWATPAAGGAYVGVNAQTGTTYTLVLADRGKLVTCSNTGAITVTIPTNASVAFPVGSQVDVAVMNTGMVTFVGASGVTVNGTPSLVTRARYSAVTLIKVATNQWLTVGDLA